MDGNIQKTFELIESYFPNIFETYPKIELLLHCQDFLEIIKIDFMKAIQYAQQYLSKYPKEATIYTLKNGKIEEILLEVNKLLIN